MHGNHLSFAGVQIWGVIQVGLWQEVNMEAM